MFIIDVKIDKGVERLGRLPDETVRALKMEVIRDAVILKEAVRAKVSNDVFNIRTGTLLKGITTQVRANKKGVRGKLFSKDPVVNIFKNGATIPAHLIAAKNVKALHFIASGGGELYASSVMVPGAKLAQRNPIGEAMTEHAAEIREGIQEAVAGAIRVSNALANTYGTSSLFK